MLLDDDRKDICVYIDLKSTSLNEKEFKNITKCTEIYNLILIPFIIKYGFVDNERKYIKIILTIIFIVVFYLNYNGMYYCSQITGYVH